MLSPVIDDLDVSADTSRQLFVPYKGYWYLHFLSRISPMEDGSFGLLPLIQFCFCLLNCKSGNKVAVWLSTAPTSAPPDFGATWHECSGTDMYKLLCMILFWHIVCVLQDARLWAQKMSSGPTTRCKYDSENLCGTRILGCSAKSA